MRKSRYTDSQILAILKQNENGVAVPELCREYGMSSAQFYKWRAKFSGIDASWQGAYAASKHAVKGFTESLRVEVVEKEVPFRSRLLIQPPWRLRSLIMRKIIWSFSDTTSSDLCA
jgi:transposase-like protein